MKKKTVLIIDLSELPTNLRYKLAENEMIGNYSFHKFHSEIIISKGMAGIEDYYKDQQENNAFEGSLEDFIKKYRLEMEVWIINQGMNLEGIEDILIDICW